MKRDCTCPRAKHQHGTVMGYANDNCHCPECRAAWAAYRRRQVRRKAWAQWNRPLYVPPVGTARRLQALAAVGWAPADLSPLIGSTKSQILKWRSGKIGWVYAETADRIATVYNQVADAPTPSRYALKVQRCAERNGWHPPIAWDDDTIDDPNAKPYASAPVDIDEIAVEQACNGRRVNLTRAERLAAVATLTERGYSEKQISELLGRPARTVARDKAALRGQDAA